jgi:hypothetical protein
VNFWQVHGALFLLGATFFPRLTMLFAVSAPFGILPWLGWLFVLCAIAWFVAIFGTAGEGKVASKGARTKK